jgi:Cd2+/Zn2+-exporting ATPase
MEKLTLKIDGMCCAEEIATLKRALNGIVPEERLAFDLLNGRLMVEGGESSAGAVIAAVNTTGMRAVRWSDHLARQQAGESFWSRHGRVVCAGLSASAIAGGFVIHAFSEGIHAAISEGGEGGLPLFSIALYVIAIVSGGWYVLPKAWFAVRALRPDMNLLMVTAVIGAGVLGEWFEAASVSCLFAIALLLESWSVGRARKAIGALMDLAPARARFICPNDGDIEDKPVGDVPLGVTVLVRPGERIPLDGVVSKGATTINQAPITGESVPVSKAAGDPVYAGTINEDGAIEFTSTSRADDTTLSRIVRMVEEGQQRRAQAEQWVERFARY